MESQVSKKLDDAMSTITNRYALRKYVFEISKWL
jgi:hypothetical protein